MQKRCAISKFDDCEQPLDLKNSVAMRVPQL